MAAPAVAGYQKELVEAARVGDTARVQALLQLQLQGSRQLDASVDGDAPLRAACAGGHADVVRELLALRGPRAVNVCAGCHEPLFLACANGHLGVLDLLLAAREPRTVDVNANNGQALYWACRNGRVGVLERLLALQPPHAPLNVQAADNMPIRVAAQWGQTGIVDILLALTGARAVDVRAGDDYALRYAAGSGHAHVVRTLLDLTGPRAVNVHAQQDCALRWAVQARSTHVVRLLVSLRGARAVPTAVLTAACREAVHAAHMPLLAALLSGAWAPPAVEVAAWSVALPAPTAAAVRRVQRDAAWARRGPAVTARAAARRAAGKARQARTAL